MRKVTLLLCCLLGQDVAFVSMLSFDLSGAGKLEAFLGSGVGLHFWHYRRLLICSTVQDSLPVIGLFTFFSWNRSKVNKHPVTFQLR